MLIDEIDHQLDQDMAAVILPRLHQAFPNLQIIVTGNRPELLEQAQDFQCLKLENKQLHPIHLNPMQVQYDHFYAELLEISQNHTDIGKVEDALQEPETANLTAQSVLQLIQEQLSVEQQQELLQLLSQDNSQSLPQSS